MTRVARYLRLDVLLLLFCVGGLIRYGSTKGTNGNDRSGSVEFLRGSFPTLVPVAVDSTGFSIPANFPPITNLCFWGIERGSNAVLLGMSWPATVAFTNAAVDLYGSASLASNAWTRIAEIDVSEALSNAVVEVPFVAFPTNAMEGAAFFRVASQDDADGDGLPDSYEEWVLGSNPTIADTDGDGLFDGWEDAVGLDPLSATGPNGARGDPDVDGVANADEFELGTHPTVSDTDHDGISDGDEAIVKRVFDDFPAEICGDVVTNLTGLFSANNERCVDYDLPVSAVAPGGVFDRLTVDLNGLAYLRSTSDSSTIYTQPHCSSMTRMIIPQGALVIAPYWARLGLSTNTPASSVVIRQEVGLTCVEWANMRVLDATDPEQNRVTVQLVIPDIEFPLATFIYRISGTETDGRHASVGVCGAGGRYRRSLSFLSAGSVVDHRMVEVVFGLGTDPLAADTDCDGLSDGQEISLGTDPLQPDTDGDCMDDGWETQHGFDPTEDNALDSDFDNDIDADPDQDGLTNGEECEWGTDPHDTDTDGDGIPDGAEIAQNSDPSDILDGGVPNSRVPVPFYFGDPSGSHSEKYRLEVTPVVGTGDTPTSYSWLNANYGECETKTAMLKPGWKYEVRLYHAGTNGRVSICPDYDYQLNCGNNGVPPANVIVDDPASLLGRDETSFSFGGEGKVACIYVLAPPAISAPSAVGVNNDDDNANGTPDWEEEGAVSGDDDLGVMRVSVMCPPGLSGTVEVRPFVGAMVGTVWKDRDRTQSLETAETFAVSSGEAARTYFLEGINPSSRFEVEFVRAVFRCGGTTLTNEFRFTFVERIAEPITTERFGGQVVNPCCAVIGGMTRMKVSVQPDDFPENRINWRVVSGSGALTDATGREAEFVASGAEGEDVVVQVDVGDCPGRAPQFTMLTTTMHEVKIYPCAISRMGKPSPITVSQINSMLDEVNVIYRQVGMHFSLGASLMCVTNDVWAQKGLVDSNVSAQIRDIISGTDGLEVYFILGKNVPRESFGKHTSYGIIVKAPSSAAVLAHEIGHACGWGDIYSSRGENAPSVLFEGLRRSWMIYDWNNGTGCRFYDQMLTQRDVIPRLLMHGVNSGGQCDIPLGSVLGLGKDGETGHINVGRNGAFVVSPHSN